MTSLRKPHRLHGLHAVPSLKLARLLYGDLRLDKKAIVEITGWNPTTLDELVESGSIRKGVTSDGEEWGMRDRAGFLQRAGLAEGYGDCYYEWTRARGSIGRRFRIRALEPDFRWAEIDAFIDEMIRRNRKLKREREARQARRTSEGAPQERQTR